MILCNLLARREDLLQLGGFNESLYPNEENALMDELQKRGGLLLYDPGLIVHRPPRPSFALFLQNALELWPRAAPSSFVCIPRCVPRPISFRLCFASTLRRFPFCRRMARWLAVVYLAAVLVQCRSRFCPGGKWFWLPRIMGLIFVSHIVYGLGFWRGCLKKPKPPPPPSPPPSKIEKIQ